MPVVGTLLLLSEDRDFRAVHTRCGWRPSNFTLDFALPYCIVDANRWDEYDMALARHNDQ